MVIEDYIGPMIGLGELGIVAGTTERIIDRSLPGKRIRNKRRRKMNRLRRIKIF